MAKKKKTTSEKIKIVKRDAILSINMSTAFYLRCKSVAAFLIEGRSQEEMSQAYEKIKNQSVDEAWIANLETILILCAEFEKQANETNNIEEVTKEELEAMFKAAAEEVEKTDSEDQK
jgi:hypothetical protein